MSKLSLALVPGGDSWMAMTWAPLMEVDAGARELQQRWIDAEVEFRYDARTYTYTLIVDVINDKGKKVSYSLFTVSDLMLVQAYDSKAMIWQILCKAGNTALQAGNTDTLSACLVAAKVLHDTWTARR